MILNAVNADSARAENGKFKATTVTSMLNAATGTDIDDNGPVAETDAAADAEHVLLSDIIQEYTTEPWFADKNHTAELESWQGLRGRKKTKEKFVLFSDYNGSLPRRQHGAMTIGQSPKGKGKSLT